MTSSFSPIC